MQQKKLLADKHNLLESGVFFFKSSGLTAKRYFQNLFLYKPKSFRDNRTLLSEPLIAVSETDLWNPDDNEYNFILTAGKIQNLRVAAQKINGIEVPAGEVFSFWKHIGKPSKSKGYVVGRELREGCIIPTIAGGLCQLSNALYDAALKAGFEIVERHRHTKVIKGSLAEKDRDATVKWNYIDLRFRSSAPFRIEIDFTSEKLIVRFRSSGIKKDLQELNYNIPSAKLNDCYSCGNTACFKHPGKIEPVHEKSRTTYILDEKWPEYERYLQSIASDNDHFITALNQYSLLKTPRYLWTVRKKNSQTFFPVFVKRALTIRYLAKSNANLPTLFQKFDQKIIQSLKHKIPVESTHIVISQNLLPYAWKEGLLWGRTFDVLMTRLPMQILQQQLDEAHAKHPESRTLKDFRADKEWMELENIALTKARKIITPHRAIADIFNNKCVKLDWLMPAVSENKSAKGQRILFPASALGRKGAYEIRRLVKELNLELVVLGRSIEEENFWKGISLASPSANPLDNISAVVLPAWIEHQPRFLLKALAAGIPVIASDACGLDPHSNLTIVPCGDFEKLKEAVEKVLLLNDVVQ